MLKSAGIALSHSGKHNSPIEDDKRLDILCMWATLCNKHAFCHSFTFLHITRLILRTTTFIIVMALTSWHTHHLCTAVMHAGNNQWSSITCSSSWHVVQVSYFINNMNTSAFIYSVHRGLLMTFVRLPLTGDEYVPISPITTRGC